MSEAFIVDAVRSPIGRRNGTLASIRGDELSAQVVNGLVDRGEHELKGVGAWRLYSVVDA